MLESNPVNLQFVEITPYKRNVHVALQLYQGSDKQVCKHLNYQLRGLRAYHSQLVNALLQHQNALKERDNHIELLEKREHATKEQQAVNEAHFRERLKEEIAKERQRTDDDINEVK